MDFFDGLEAIAMTWIRWKGADWMNAMQVHFITLDPHTVSIAKHAPGEGVRDFLTSAIDNLRNGVPPQTQVLTFGEACSAGADQAPHP